MATSPVYGTKVLARDYHSICGTVLDLAGGANPPRRGTALARRCIR